MGDSHVAHSEAKLPPPRVYEQEYSFWPWGCLLEEVAQWVIQNAPPGSHVVDYMCGTGFLLDAIHSRRQDVSVEGWDISTAFIAYGKLRYPEARLYQGDALEAEPTEQPDIVLCTAGIHHLTSTEKGRFIEKVADQLHRGGTFVVGEETLSLFSSECERQFAVIKLHTALLQYASEHSAPSALLEAACDVLANDLLERGEYKISLSDLHELVQPFFIVEQQRWVWSPQPNEELGDIVLICRAREQNT